MSFKTLAARLTYNGGTQLERIREQKLRSLKAALKNDYNSRMIKTQKHSAWPCLINKNLLKSDYDRQYISVEFDAGLNAGDTFECLDDGTHWLIYLPILTETAYLRSEIIRCRYTLEIDGVTYWLYFQGPTETTIQWFQKSGLEYNEPNLSGTIYIKLDERTKKFFKRFTTFKIAGHIWQSQVVDYISVPGVLEIEVQEYYDNTIAELPRIEDATCDEIVGVQTVEQSKTYGFKIRDAYYNPSYSWKILNNNRVEILRQLDDNRQCEVLVHDGAVKGFTLEYGDGRSGYHVDINIARRCDGIHGPKTVYPYDIVDYRVPVDGEFWLQTDIAKILEQDSRSCKIEVITSKSGKFDIYFKSEDGTEVKSNIKVDSL